MKAAIESLGEASLVVALLMLALSFVVARTPSLLRVTSVACCLLLAMWMLSGAISGFLEGRAMEISPHDASFARDRNEQAFWASVVFHLAIASILAYLGLRLITVPYSRWLAISEKARFSTVLRFGAWFFLVLMIGALLIATRVYEIAP